MVFTIIIMLSMYKIIRLAWGDPSVFFVVVFIIFFNLGISENCEFKTGIQGIKFFIVL